MPLNMRYIYISFDVCSQWKIINVANRNLYSRLKIQTYYGSGIKDNFKGNRAENVKENMYYYKKYIKFAM